jgi:hypothetical protein
MVADKLYCYLRNESKFRTHDLFFESVGDKVNEAERELFNPSLHTYSLSACNGTLLCTNEMLNW